MFLHFTNLNFLTIYAKCFILFLTKGFKNQTFGTDLFPGVFFSVRLSLLLSKIQRAITNLPVYKIFNDSRVLTEPILQMIALIHQAHSPIAPELISDKKNMVLEPSQNGRARDSSK